MSPHFPGVARETGHGGPWALDSGDEEQLRCRAAGFGFAGKKSLVCTGTDQPENGTDLLLKRHSMRPAHLAWLTIALSMAGPTPMPMVVAADLATDRPAGTLEVVATFGDPMPTGVTVSHTARIFVCFPRWGDLVDFTVAEVKRGQVVAYPSSAFNTPEPGHPADRLISVQSV